jgi:NitT/TauT family transport system ATP-binding protein
MLTISNLTKQYSDKALFSSFNFNFEAGLVYTIFGPNGCGKSTLLNMIACLDTDYTGDIEFGGLENNLSFVFQNYNESIMPWLSVYQNIELGFGDKFNNGETTNQIEKILKIANISHLSNQKAYRLSGGQKQLVCILRSLVNQPRLLLMDEPFSAIDFLNTRTLHSKFKELIRVQLHKPICLIVTHDPIEAIILGDRVLTLGKDNSVLVIDTSKVTDYNDTAVLENQKKILDWVKYNPV